jgi:hypothetical protein
MHTVLPDHLLLFVQGRSHGNPKSLGLFTPGDDASVVVGENHHGLPVQGGVKDPLARTEEVIAVYQS